MTATMTADEIDCMARKNAGRKMGWYLHACVFIAVNTGLALAATLSGRHYALASVFGWGIGLLIHGAVVFLVAPGGHLRERLVQKEREKLQKYQDKW